MYLKLLESTFVIDKYKMITKLEKDSGTAKHDLSHILRVESYAEELLSQLDVDKELLESIQIAILFHDIGCIKGKKNHAVSSYEIISEWIATNNIHIPNQDKILNAVISHSEIQESHCFITLVLQMCDKIDLVRDRLTPIGLATKGIRQIQYIDNVSIEVTMTNLSISYHANPSIDFEELLTFGFLKKTFQSVEALAKYLNLSSSVKINNRKLLLNEFL